jgi:alpha-D-glucose phosphate-specific phosphoglucomutase
MAGRPVIKFGTSGWRGRIAEDFTFAGVRLVAQAIATHLRRSEKELVGKGVIVGWDTRFMGELFAEAAGEVLAGNNIPVLFCPGPTATPVLSHAVIKGGLAGALNITASHNPFTWSGIKFTPSWGGPALPEATKDIEAAAAESGEIAQMPRREAERKRLWRRVEPSAAYLEDLGKIVRLEVLRGSPHDVAVDLFHGTGRGLLDAALEGAGWRVRVFGGDPDPYFGHVRPDPSGEAIEPFARLVGSEPFSLGLATDPDADRFGVVDADGTIFYPNEILALLLDYLAESRGWRGGAICRSVATTHLLDRVARHHGLAVIETPVGFKYVGELLSQGKIVFGGEESGGLTVAGHLPEKDGVAACLLVAEMVAGRGMSLNGMSLKEMLAEVFRKVGPVYSRRRDLDLSAAEAAALRDRLGQVTGRLAGKRIEAIVRIDGYKYLLEGSAWLLLRPSGTEPVVRVYAEAQSPGEVEELLQAATGLLAG